MLSLLFPSIVPFLLLCFLFLFYSSLLRFLFFSLHFLSAFLLILLILFFFTSPFDLVSVLLSLCFSLNYPKISHVHVYLSRSLFFFSSLYLHTHIGYHPYSPLSRSLGILLTDSSHLKLFFLCSDREGSDLTCRSCLSLSLSLCAPILPLILILLQITSLVFSRSSSQILPPSFTPLP